MKKERVVQNIEKILKNLDFYFRCNNWQSKPKKMFNITILFLNEQEPMFAS